MSEDIQARPRYSAGRTLSAFARRHPVLAVAGLGSAALIGGIELAAGVVVGAGLDAMLRRPRRLSGEIAASTETGEMHDMSASLASRARLVRERARAVLDAARGRPYAAPSETPHVEAASPEAPARESSRSDSTRYETPATD